MPFFFDYYPYTNFHNVNLDWVIQEVKAWGKVVEKNDKLYTDLKAAFDDFKKFVQDYLAELDISEEINDKLDQMLEDGTLTPYFAPYIRNYTEQYVNQWLGSHVDPTAPALDDTLTLSNAAAQAAAAGRRLGEAAYFAAWETPHDYTYIKLADVIPGYRLNSIAYDYNGHYYACGGSIAKNGMGFIAVMSKPDFSDAVVTEIPGLGHANDITYDNGYLYICTANDNGESEGGAPLNAIVKIKADDFTNRTVISNCPENTIGICFVRHGFWILAPYRIYSTTDFTSYTLVVSNIYAMMESYGLDGTGRLVQSLYRSPGNMPALVCAFVRDGSHYGAITFFDHDSGEAVGFKTFESYQGEVEGAVYGEGTTWIVTDSSGGGATILRSDLLRQRYNLLATGDDLNDIVGDSISYCTGSNVAAGVLHGPVSDTGYTVFTYRQGLYNTTQVASDNRGKFWHRYHSYTSGAWRDWEELGGDAEVAQIKEDLDDVNERLGEVEDELGVAPKMYTGTITEANTYTRIAENLSFDPATGYKFTFKISAPLNTDVYFNVMRTSENQLFSKTIPAGETNAERVYTTSASVPVTAGYILARANATNVNVEVEIEPVTGTPSRIDIVEQTEQKLKQYPYSTLPNYVLGGAWYKPLGSLSKGYFCFVTDDGRIGMNEYTIPTLVIGKGMKCTFAIMSASEVMADAEKIAVVKDAVDNYGCSVAQHGGNRWTSFTEYQLNEFFDTEKAFFDGIGIAVRGAVIPEHYNSQLIYAVAGGKYGVVRSGYDGHIYPTVCPYANYSNGPRSNLYGLTSYNIVDKSLDNNKAAVDSAIANHRLMIVYIHENSLDDAKKAVIEGLMDYVNETGITQVTLGDIPYII